MSEKTVFVPFASPVEAFGYSMLAQRRNDAAREFSKAGEEIGRRGGVAGSWTSEIVEGGVRFTVLVPDAPADVEPARPAA